MHAIMETAETTLAHPRTHASPAEPARFDLYTQIHKAIRAWMCDVLTRAGRMDSDDPADVAATLAAVRVLLAACRSHLAHENDFLHTAIEARQPGAARQTADDHTHHDVALERLEASVRAVERTAGATRSVAALELYRQLALFVADNFQHIHVEETQNNAALWAGYDDAELVALHDALVASIPPLEMAGWLRWLIPSVSPAERAAMLAGMRQSAPAEAVSGALAIAQAHLDSPQWHKLSATLCL
jgi:hypothetical protein